MYGTRVHLHIGLTRIAHYLTLPLRTNTPQGFLFVKILIIPIDKYRVFCYI